MGTSDADADADAGERDVGARERDVEQAERAAEKTADDLQRRASELGDEIDAVRQDFTNKRNDQNVAGLPPEPEEERSQEEATSEPGDESD